MAVGVMLAGALTVYGDAGCRWRDDVPYLVAHARWGEAWAYEALGDCCKYGRGGLPQSMIEANNYYRLADDARDLTYDDFFDFHPLGSMLPSACDVFRYAGWREDVRRQNSTDVYDAVGRLFDLLHSRDFDEVQRVVMRFDLNGYRAADVLLDVIASGNPRYVHDVIIKERLQLGKKDVDKFVWAFAGLWAIDESYEFWNEDAYEQASFMMADVAPSIYNDMGVYAYRDRDYDKAVEYLVKADDHGCLEPYAASVLLDIYENRMTPWAVEIPRRELNRLRMIRRLSLG